MTELNSKLAIGTANFGLEYGVTNNNGRLSDAEIKNIMQEAKISNVTTFDTAQGYGDSEERLGSFVNEEINIITKIGNELNTNKEYLDLHQIFIGSLCRLKCEKVYGLLLHDPNVLLGQNGGKIVRELRQLKDEGSVEKIGVSIYEPETLTAILPLFDFDLVQVPFNVFNREVYFSGWVDKLKSKNIEIHVRSVFLQGILLSQRRDLPNWFLSNWPDLFDQWFDFQMQVGANADEVALRFALQQPWIDKVIVGVDNASQLGRLVEIENINKQDYRPKFFSRDPVLIYPSKWKNK